MPFLKEKLYTVTVRGDPEEGVFVPKPVATLGRISGRGPLARDGSVGGTEQSLIAEGLGTNTPSGERASAQSFSNTSER